jgi:chromosome partitioning protein
MLTIVVSSLSGGQGKTTISMLLGFMLSERGYSTLLIDADPQHSLSDWLGVDLEPNSPTLLECLKSTIELEDCIYPLGMNENLFIIPSDDQLDNVQDYLACSGIGAMLLKKRLEPIATTFDICIIDAPPQRSQVCLTAIGAGDIVIIPAEASVKGYGSSIRTIDLVNNLHQVGATTATIMGIVPFRDRWIGANQSQESKLAIEGMKEEFGTTMMLPSIGESERYKQAINQQKTLSALGYSKLEYPLEVLIEKIESIVAKPKSVKKAGK